MSSLWCVKVISLTGLMTEEASISSNEERLGRPVSPPCPTIAPPSPPRQSRSSIPLDDHFEGPSTENQAHHGTVKEFTEGGRCTYIFYIISCTVGSC